MINFKLIVIYEDECFLVIDKPVGLVVNSSLTAKDETLQEYIEQISDFSKVDPNSEFNLRKGIVHRLDKKPQGGF